jgi:hypothetical protein
MYQSTKTDTKKLSTEVKGDNYCYRKFGRAITIWEAIQKRIYPSSMKNPASHTITAIYTFFINISAKLW